MDKVSIENMARQLLELVAEGRLLPKSMMPKNIDELLDIADSEESEAIRLPRTDRLMEIRKDYPKEELSYIYDLIEKIFVHVFKITKSDDFAAYVSEDFGMIVMSLHFGIEDVWINGVVNAYGSGKIPWQGSQDSEGTLLSHLEVIVG